MSRGRRFLIGLLALLGTTVVSTRLYLSSALAAEQVASRLGEVYGGKVSVNGADIGFRSSELQGLKLYEDGSDEPWATAQDIEAALTLWDIVLGNTIPDDVTLRGVSVTLRYDSNGRLLTRLPRPKKSAERVGVFHIRDGTVTVRQEGRPELVVTQVNADLHPEGDRVMLTGSAHTADWGEWAVKGAWQRSSNEFELNLKKEPAAAVTQAQLDALPFVSPKVWEHVRIDGKTTVDLTLRRTDRMQHRILLDVTDARLRVTSIDLDADQTSGRVLVDDGYVELSDVSGKVAEGDVQMSGELNFRTKPDVLHFTVAVQGAKVADLPASWFRKYPLAQRVGGRLKGTAELTVTIRDGEAQTTGAGKGEVHGARVFGVERPPMAIKLLFKGKEIEFDLGAGAAAPPS